MPLQMKESTERSNNRTAFQRLRLCHKRDASPTAYYRLVTSGKEQFLVP